MHFCVLPGSSVVDTTMQQHVLPKVGG